MSRLRSALDMSLIHANLWMATDPRQPTQRGMNLRSPVGASRVPGTEATVTLNASSVWSLSERPLLNTVRGAIAFPRHRARGRCFGSSRIAGNYSRQRPHLRFLESEPTEDRYGKLKRRIDER